jgi:1,4-dihydroxy-2-naphthoate octaprenyltransferase
MHPLNTDTPLNRQIDSLLGHGGRLFLATSVDGNSSGSAVFYARDGDSLVFFTFNATRKAEQIRANPRVQAVVWSNTDTRIRGLQIDGHCRRIHSADEAARARRLILEVTDAFVACMDDEFLSVNQVTGYYRLTPHRIRYIDFDQDPPFQERRFRENEQSTASQLAGDVGRRARLWLRTMRAPFFTATLAPVLLGASVAALQLTVDDSGAFDWRLFWLALTGALAAHAGANLANDFGDHLSGNDEINRTPSPFNGGSRVIQAGLLAPWKVLFGASVGFLVCALCGLTINHILNGAWYAPSPLLAMGVIGLVLAAGYTLGPFRLGYRGWGEVAIAAGFGPVMVLGTHYVLTAAHGETWHWLEPALASLPVAVLVMLIVWINQFQDAPADLASGKRTWVVRLAGGGETLDYVRPFRWYQAFNTLAFGLVIVLAGLPLAGGPGTHFAIIALLPALWLPGAFRTGRRWLEDIAAGEVDWRRHPYALLPVNATTIGIHLATSLLLALAYVLEARVG